MARGQDEPVGAEASESSPQFRGQELTSWSRRNYDGNFAFFLTILEAVEEESGSEASAKELIQLISLVEKRQIPAVFAETHGSLSAPQIISAETGVPVYLLNMGMGDSDYFEAIRTNIDTLKEALG